MQRNKASNPSLKISTLMLIWVHASKVSWFLFVPSICKTLNLPRIAKSWHVDMHTIRGVQPLILMFLDVYRKVVTKYLTKIVGDFQ
jgi:hypothetical protein